MENIFNDDVLINNFYEDCGNDTSAALYDKTNNWLKLHGCSMKRKRSCGAKNKKRMSETEKINLPFKSSRKADRKRKRKTA